MFEIVNTLRIHQNRLDKTGNEFNFDAIVINYVSTINITTVYKKTPTATTNAFASLEDRLVVPEFQQEVLNGIDPVKERWFLILQRQQNSTMQGRLAIQL